MSTAESPCPAAREAKRGSRFDLIAAFVCFAFIVFTLASLAIASPLHAAEAPLMKRGDGVVTTFSGTARSRQAADGAHPQDQVLIDPAGSVLRVLDLSDLGGAPSGQIADVTEKLKISAGDIGQVFSVVLAEAEPGADPDIYAAATSLFGLQIIATGPDGKTVRLVRGAPAARWAPGQFGLDFGGGPGTIWKIDGSTGAVTPFATIRSGDGENSGPGLGGLTFDSVSRQIFVSSLETGLMHRLDLSGRELGVFDHGLAGRGALMLPQVPDDPGRRMDIHDAAFNAEDPQTWGYADKKRRVTGLAIEAGRLFYAIAEGPSVWSVGLLADGSIGDDARLEIDVAGTPENNPITTIAFDGSKAIYLTQRGDTVGSYDYATLARPRTSVVYRYTWDETAKSWTATPDEYAVGMPSPHRATDGGAALSYGYEASGRAEFGSCRATLWTTGEALRANPKGDLINGLQGTAASNASPASATRARSGSEALQGDFGVYESDLAPPEQSWFIDAGNGPRGGHGQIGALAIHAPCDAEVASADPERLPVPVVPPVPPAPKPGIAISKICHPGPLGGVIPCTITLTNVGWTLTGPVGFTDVSKVLAGPDNGAAVLIKSATPDGADWICSPTPSATFSCQLPPAALLPGQSRSVDVFVDTGPLVAAGNSGFRNCASLALPWSGMACVESQTQIVVKKTAPASCLPGNACTFALTVTNAGGHAFDGDVLLSDSLFMDGGVVPVAAPITAIAPALGCGPDPVALPFSCLAPIALAAGQSKAFSITVTMPAAPANYWAHNCFAASAPGQPAPALPPGPGSDPNAVSCAWVPVGAPPPLANLRIGKSPLTCHKQGPDTVRCHYDITLENTGPSPSTNLITFSETIPANSVLASIAAPWSCVGGPPAFTCSTAAAPVIAPGGSLTIPVAIDLERAPLEAAKCWAPNKVAITSPVGGTDQNFDATDDAATATADAAWIRFDEGGPLELVLCDPTNLQTKKVADGPCVADGNGTRCGYTVTVTNTGPDPFNGRIDVTDAFSTAPTDVAFGAGWDCGGAGANWTCSHAPLALLKGQSVSLAVTAKFAKTSQCVVSNRATMIFPPANTRWNGSGADDSAVAFSSIPSPECERAPKCDAPAEGEVRTASGACACAAGLARDRKGRCVKVVVEAEPVPETPISTPACTPGANETLTASGACVCKRGFERRDGRCVADQPEPEQPPLCKPGPHEHRTSSNRCVCDDGYERNRDGRCVLEKPEVCPPGTYGTPPRCRQKVCDEGYTGTWPECRPITCPPGMTGRPPKCVPKTCPFGTRGTPPDCKPIEPPRCPLGQIGKPPNCRPMLCPPGTTGVPPKCKAIETPRCPPGTTGTPPKCKAIETPKCPSGTVGKPPNCQKVDPPKCPPGTSGKPPRCVKVVKPCPKGQIRNDKGQCVVRKVEVPKITPKVDTKVPVKVREPVKPPAPSKEPDIR
jgi:uncharacterized repeat protein (TIGR01451 family)